VIIEDKIFSIYIPMSNFSTHALAYTNCNDNYKILPNPLVTSTEGNAARYVSSQIGGKSKKYNRSHRKSKKARKSKKSKKGKKGKKSRKH
jgi:hypothetical protein